ncbi:MAG: DUF2062 domain-containing protein [Flavobacteriales bacterium]
MTETDTHTSYPEQAARLGVCVLIPVYNNAGTIEQVIRDVQAYCRHIIVVADGSTDGSADIARSVPGIKVLQYTPNRGKGYALRLGLAEAEKDGYTYAITIDSDGQHFAKDIPVFLDAVEKEPGSLVVGARIMEGQNQAKKSSFANKFSNFWYFADTLHSLPDTQSGYRIYPVKRVNRIYFFSTKYEFEVEVLVKACWRGIPVRSVPVSVYYPPENERVSFFRPGKDFTRISILNTYLLIMAVVYGHWAVIIRSLSWKNIKRFVKKNFFSQDEPVVRKAFSVGFGVFMGIVPIWGWQMIVAAFLAHFLKLNKAIVLLSSNISVAPMVPVIIWLSVRTGKWVIPGAREENLTLDYFREHPGEFLVRGSTEYLVGSVVFAVLAGVFFFVLSWVLLKLFSYIQRSENKDLS